MVSELLFEDRLRKVRCQPGDRAHGTFSTTALADPGELSGNFDIKLARCEDAETGMPLGWPPKPLLLHGIFDRLPLDIGAKRRLAEFDERVTPVEGGDQLGEHPLEPLKELAAPRVAEPDPADGRAFALKGPNEREVLVLGQ